MPWDEIKSEEIRGLVAIVGTQAVLVDKKELRWFGDVERVDGWSALGYGSRFNLYFHPIAHMGRLSNYLK